MVRVNSPPVLTGVAAQTVTEGNTLSFVVRATDVDGDDPIFVAVSLPPGATLSSTGTFSWPNATPVGNAILRYFSRDNHANSAQGTVNISVIQGTPAVPATPIEPTSGGGGGGCTLSQTDSVDILLPALFLFGLALQAWRLKKSIKS
ncbi:MAG TPA: JDVT-CTERM domain-containing protein [Nitrospiraceae bacterium]|nr:JDVT-CTERM domain-containing protein [Nitrospiraceae bacterium]